jgi:hypothetical protein
LLCAPRGPGHFELIAISLSLDLLKAFSLSVRREHNADNQGDDQKENHQHPQMEKSYGRERSREEEAQQAYSGASGEEQYSLAPARYLIANSSLVHRL